MSRVRAYAVKRLDGKPFPVGPMEMHPSELSPDGLLFWCVDRADAQNCVDRPHPDYGPVELVEGWTTIHEWNTKA